MSKIFINEDIGYLPLEEALIHLTDDWICGGNVSHETVITMRDALRGLTQRAVDICPACAGTGILTHNRVTGQCPLCVGTGKYH
jgi:hypothetical protein